MKQVDLATSSPAAVCQGWGAFFSPPVFVGTPLDWEALKKQNNGCRTFVKALDTVYKGRQVIISREGLVVLAEPDQAAAVELLNEVMAVLLLRVLPVCTVRETDLVECSIGMVNKEIESGEWWYKLGNPAVLERGFDFRLSSSRFYHPDNVKAFIRRAELMTNHPAIRMDLRLLLEAYTHHQELAYATSFLLSWLGIARSLHRTKVRLLAEHPQGDGDGQSVSADSGWDASGIIEELHLRNAFDATVYQEAKRLCQKYSNVIRGDEEVTSGESGSCYYFFQSQLRQTLASG